MVMGAALGASLEAGAVLWLTFLQREVPPRHLGRVTGFNYAWPTATAAVGLPAWGLLLEAYPAPMVGAFIGGFNPALGLCGLGLLQIWRRESQDRKLGADP